MPSIDKIMEYIPGAVYGLGVVIIGASEHLHWWTGFGIWLAGFGLAMIVISALYD